MTCDQYVTRFSPLRSISLEVYHSAQKQYCNQASRKPTLVRKVYS